MKVKYRKVKWPLIAHRSRQQQTKQNETSNGTMEGRIVKELNHPRDNTSAATIPLSMTQASPRSPCEQDGESQLTFLNSHSNSHLHSNAVLFSNTTFKSPKISNTIANIIPLNNKINQCVSISGRSEDSDFYHYGHSFTGYKYSILYPTSYLISNARSKPFDFINLREQVVLKGVFDVNVNGCNENFYTDRYYYNPSYPTTTAGRTSTITMTFNGINTEICKINILQCIFGIALCSNDNNNVICNSMSVCL